MNLFATRIPKDRIWRKRLPILQFVGYVWDLDFSGPERKEQKNEEEVRNSRMGYIELGIKLGVREVRERVDWR